MKPFDLELAKAGHPVCTRDGRDVRIVCFDRNGKQPIVGLVTEYEDIYERCEYFSSDGYWDGRDRIPPHESGNDLFMKTTTRKVKVYVAIPKKSGCLTTLECPAYDSMDAARIWLNHKFSEYNFIESEIEIEE